MRKNISNRGSININNSSWNYLINNFTDSELIKIVHITSTLKTDFNICFNNNIPHTKHTLAEFLDIVPDNLTRLMKRLESLGIVKCVSGKDFNYKESIYIMNPLINSAKFYSNSTLIESLFENSNVNKNLLFVPNVLETDSTHNLYILKQTVDSEDLFKFGYSSRINKRLIEYANHNPGIKLYYSWFRNDAKEFELDFHKNNISLYKNEWYRKETIDKLIVL